MDYDIFKEIVVGKIWKETKSGDEYRSIRIQLDNFIEHIEEEGSPLKWLPIESMTEKELAEIAIKFIFRNPENRLLFNGLKYHGMKHNYDDLNVEIRENEKEQKSILKNIPELKEYKPLDIAARVYDVNAELIKARHTGYQKTVEELGEISDNIYRAIYTENNEFIGLGLDIDNMDYIEQYIEVCERICLGTLYFMVIDNENIPDKKDALIKIENSFNEVVNVYQHPEVDVRRSLKIDRKAEKDVIGNIIRNQADTITMCYIQYLNRRDYYAELINIEELIKEEGFLSKPAECPDMNGYLKDYISEGRRIPSFDKKLAECQRLIEIFRKYGKAWGGASDNECLKICMLEGYVSKVVYQRRRAFTVIRNILSSQNDRPSKQDTMFLDAKILHGVFREKGLTEEYDIFIRISRDVRKAFLFSYSAVVDDEIYKLIRSTCYKLLKIFDARKSAVLKLE